MIREPSESALEQAAKRLERALQRLEQQTAAPSRGASGGGLFDQDAQRLSAELDKSRDRERQLEEAGAAASEALGRAIDEIRAALGAPETASAAGE